MYRIGKEVTFDAAHQLYEHDGKCRNLHGHSYRVLVDVMAESLLTTGPSQGMVVDFGKIKKVIHGKYDHQNINLIAPFDSGLPSTAENLSKVIWEDVQEALSGQENSPLCVGVTVWETETSFATYTPHEGI